MKTVILYLILFSFPIFTQGAAVKLGCDRLFETTYVTLIKGKRLGLVTNQTGINCHKQSTLEVLKNNRKKFNYKITAFFAPEHGLSGEFTAEESVSDSKDEDGTPIYSLHGKHVRPTSEMLQNIDVIIYDIQDIGSRSYTYATTLFYVMEEAASRDIQVVVLDRPNPINGLTVDGPILKDELKSIVGYLNVPYCHGLTIGEQALYFNGEYKLGCRLEVVPMEGWQRWMSYMDTGLTWVPTSPHVPEAVTPLYYPATGILGELSLVSIGVGYTLPFQLVGAPWIDANVLAENLNKHRFPGVYFLPWHFKPFYGRYAKEVCHGVLLRITDPLNYLPVTTQYLILGTLKNLYRETFMQKLHEMKERYGMFNKVNGTQEVLEILLHKEHIIWPLRELHAKERETYRKIRKKYLIPAYGIST